MLKFKTPRTVKLDCILPLAQAINIFQACIYKSVKTGLFLKSNVAPRLVKFNMLLPVFTFKYHVFLQKSVTLWN